jgi:hypothetical protein
MALRRDWIPSPNHSGRSGGVRLIILHTAEGALTYQSLGNYFASPSAEVSSHVGIDDTPGVIGEYVSPDRASWTAGNVNGYSIQAELCAFAAWTSEWNGHPVMLENTAAWIAEEAARFGIPLVHSTSHGVCQHVDVSGPGGHWDCGPGFPFARVLEMARTGAAAPTPPPVRPEDEREVTAVVSEVVRHRNIQLSCAQASNGQLWHKFSQDGGTTWRSEPLIRPNGQPVKATVKDTVSISSVDGTLFITTEDEDNVAWMCRQSDDITTGWDIRALS